MVLGLAAGAPLTADRLAATRLELPWTVPPAPAAPTLTPAVGSPAAWTNGVVVDQLYDQLTRSARAGGAASRVTRKAPRGSRRHRRIGKTPSEVRRPGGPPRVVSVGP